MVDDLVAEARRRAGDVGGQRARAVAGGGQRRVERGLPDDAGDRVVRGGIHRIGHGGHRLRQLRRRRRRAAALALLLLLLLLVAAEEVECERVGRLLRERAVGEGGRAAAAAAARRVAEVCGHEGVR
jgi:hypothetical protein